MENFHFLLDGFGVALSLSNILAALIGAVLGLIIGAMPGIGSLAGVALLLPLTFKMNPTTGIIMLAAIYYADMYGGSFSAILLNIPGDSPAVMTTLDGYKLTTQGKAGKALFSSNFSSFVGGTIGIILLTIVGPALADIGIKFGPAEMASLILLALTSIGWLLGEDPIKGLIAASIGILIATIGIDPTKGLPRFSFGSVDLMSGIDFIPLVIGMFGFSQVIEMMANKQDFSHLGGTKITLRESLLTKAEYKRIMPPTVRTGILGTFVGILPGAGATIASFLSYIFEKRVCKNGKNFGKGAIEGVAASESANNAAAAGAFAPLLALGIPGSGTAAVMLGGLMMWGLRPGPQLFRDAPDFVWGLIASMYVGNVICIVISLALIPFLMYLLVVPTSLMSPLVTVLCIVGAYSSSNSMFGVGIMLIAGVMAYFLKINNFPLAPLLLSYVLTQRLEQSIRQSFEIANGSAMIFITKPISLVLLLATVAFALSPLVLKLFKKPKQEK